MAMKYQAPTYYSWGRRKKREESMVLYPLGLLSSSGRLSAPRWYASASGVGGGKEERERREIMIGYLYYIFCFQLAGKVIGLNTHTHPSASESESEAEQGFWTIHVIKIS